MSHSQNDEEEALLAYFHGHAPARFLDIGAHDGVTLSNTRALALLGWGGVLVEPSPIPFCSLMDTYRGREEMQLVHVPICSSAGLFTMHDSRGDFVSTFDDQHRQLWLRGGAKFQPITVAGVTMTQLLEKFPGPYVFVNIDVEGLNVALFSDLKLKDQGVELVCVEFQGQIEKCDTIAGDQGFKRFHTTSENALYVRR